MHRRTIKVFAILAAAALAAACSGVSNSGIDTQTALSQIRDVYKQLGRAAAESDTAAIGGFLADGVQGKLGDGSTVGKQELAQALASRSAETHIERFEFEAGKVVAVVRPGVGGATSKETWRRSGGGWKLYEVRALDAAPEAMASR